MPQCSVMGMGTLFFISKLKFSCDKYSVDKVWTKIYGHFYFRGITLSNAHMWMAHHEYSIRAQINSLVPLQSQKQF